MAAITNDPGCIQARPAEHASKIASSLVIGEIGGLLEHNQTVSAGVTLPKRLAMSEGHASLDGLLEFPLAVWTGKFLMELRCIECRLQFLINVRAFQRCLTSSFLMS